MAGIDAKPDGGPKTTDSRQVQIPDRGVAMATVPPGAWYEMRSGLLMKPPQAWQ